MSNFAATCMVIVTEAVIESRLLRDLEDCGADGWTIVAARGRGPVHQRLNEVAGGNLRIETLVSAQVAERIWRRLAAKYFGVYAMTVWSYDAKTREPGMGGDAQG